MLTIIKESIYDLEVYNIDGVHIWEPSKQNLFARAEGMEFFIIDIPKITCGGYGELALNHFINYAIERKAESITGDISYTDYNHIDRIKAFYTKMKFELIYDGGEYPKSVFRKL